LNKFFNKKMAGDQDQEQGKPLLGDDDEEDDSVPQFTSCMAYIALPIILCYMILGGITYYFIEEKDDEHIEWQDAMYWAVLTISTAGYGDRVPRSDGGKIFTVCFIFIGLSYIAACFGMLSAQLSNRGASFHHDAPTSHDEVGNKHGDPKEKKHWLGGHLKHLIAPAILVALNMLIMTLVMHFNEEADWVTSVYWAASSLSSVGYGDPLIQKDSTRTFLTFFLLWGVCCMAWALGKVAEVVKVTEEDRKMRLLVEHGVTKALIQEIFNDPTLDSDGDGGVEKPEFIIYMLLKLNRARRSDIDELKSLFEQFDADGSGIIDHKDMRR